MALATVTLKESQGWEEAVNSQLGKVIISFEDKHKFPNSKNYDLEEIRCALPKDIWKSEEVFLDAWGMCSNGKLRRRLGLYLITDRHVEKDETVSFLMQRIKQFSLRELEDPKFKSSYTNGTRHIALFPGGYLYCHQPPIR
jgi:hypothetical protein